MRRVVMENNCARNIQTFVARPKQRFLEVDFLLADPAHSRVIAPSGANVGSIRVTRNIDFFAKSYVCPDHMLARLTGVHHLLTLPEVKTGICRQPH